MTLIGLGEIGGVSFAWQPNAAAVQALKALAVAPHGDKGLPQAYADLLCAAVRAGAALGLDARDMARDLHVIFPGAAAAEVAARAPNT